MYNNINFFVCKQISLFILMTLRFLCSYFTLLEIIPGTMLMSISENVFKVSQASWAHGKHFSGVAPLLILMMHHTLTTEMRLLSSAL